MSDTKQQSWKHGLAGCTAGLTSVLVLHPLDVIKTRLQVQDGVLGLLPAYRGTVHAVRSIVIEEGWQALYSGLSPALFGAAYSHAKQRWLKRGNSKQLAPVQHLMAAAEGGAVVCFLTNPIWVVKTRLQLQRGQRLAARRPSAQIKPGNGGPTRYKGLLDGVKTIAREEGIRGLYRGLGPSLLMVSHGAIQFMVYEELKKVLSRKKPAASKPQPLTSFEISVVGAASKLLATLTTYPFSVIRARLQQRQLSSRAVLYTDGWTTLRLVLRREGVGGLYKGVVPNLLRVMPSSAITLLVYEKLMQQMLAIDFGDADDWQQR